MEAIPCARQLAGEWHNSPGNASRSGASAVAYAPRFCGAAAVGRGFPLPPQRVPTRLGRPEAINRALPEAVQARGRAFVTGTVYEGRETVRACILSAASGYWRI